MKLNIVNEFTDAPGGRYRSQGDYSGEEFRDDYLVKRYKEALKKDEKLYLYFDGSYGYPAGFLEESFGGMIRLGFDGNDMLERMIFVSEEDEFLPMQITTYIKDMMKYNETKQKIKIYKRR